MPIGIQRLNDRHAQPSSQIVFIKPIRGPDEALAKDFLERVAAICHPIMKANHHSIMTLEEHEPNREFVGRNFNAGEIIQLVLKSQRTGQWLSFRTVQMVMMHELAHCQQMNHSRQFWAVRNQYAGELRALWARGYQGDGLWGRGRTLLSGRYHTGGQQETDEIPTALCGGVYRRRVGKRKANGSWAEQKERRIARKFGTNGQQLGDDLAARTVYEHGQQVKAKPRVANSSRGRDLRVAAALARFGDQQKEEDSENELERICGNEPDEKDSKQEMDELRNLERAAFADAKQDMDALGDKAARQEFDESVYQESPDDAKQEFDTPQEPKSVVSLEDVNQQTATYVPCPWTSSGTAVQEPTSISADCQICPICSLENTTCAITCSVCGHILDINRVVASWRCHAEECPGYVNHADNALCGACGNRNPVQHGSSRNESKA